MPVKSPKKTYKPSEHQEQSALFDWINLYKDKFPQLQNIFAVPNGAHLMHGYISFNRLLKEGFQKGVPDMFVAVPSQDKHGLFIEMKAGAKKLTKEQMAWFAKLQKYGYAAKKCGSANEAIKLLISYLELPINPSQV